MLRKIKKSERNPKLGLAYHYLRGKYGLGKGLSDYFCALGGLNHLSVASNLSPGILRKIQKVRINNFFDEIELRKFVQSNLLKKIRIRCYEGVRLSQGLPVRGQRTKTNRYTARKLNNGKIN